MKNTALFRLSRIPMTCCAAVALASGVLVCPLNAADDKPAADAGAPDMEEMMKQMEALAAPGPEHKVLASMAGEWDAEIRCWMGGPGAAPAVSKGTTKGSMILGGRYLQEDFQGEVMGRKFAGRSLTAYDKFNKKYVNIWIDDMGTGVFLSEGTCDESGKVLTLNGKMDDPMTGQKDKPMKLVTRIVSPDKHVFEMHDLTMGDQTKVMEITYTRKGGSLAGR